MLMISVTTKEDEMAINIPGAGERLGREYIRAFTFGNSSDAEIALDTGLLATGTSTYGLVNINEPGVFVKSLELQVVAKFTTSTGTFIIGDSDDPDGYWTDTLFNGAATGAVFGNMATSVGYAAGKVYTSTHVINLTKGDAAASAISASSLGKAKIRYIRGCDTDLNANT
jgi:hypothetical protein